MFSIDDIETTRLKMFRTARGLRQGELADMAQISVRTLQAYEEGLRSVNRMNLETAYKLAKALGVQMEDLVEVGELKGTRKRQ